MILCDDAQIAHAGSRTRVTSMGGLYDAATLRAPRMSQRRYVFTRIGCTMVLHSLPGQAGSMWPTRMGAQAHEGRSRLHLSVCMAAQKCASAGNRTRVTSMATMYSTTRPLMLMKCPIVRGGHNANPTLLFCGLWFHFGPRRGCMPPRRRNRTPACLHAPGVEVQSEHQPDSPRLLC